VRKESELSPDEGGGELRVGATHPVTKQSHVALTPPPPPPPPWAPQGWACPLVVAGPQLTNTFIFRIKRDYLLEVGCETPRAEALPEKNIFENKTDSPARTTLE